MARSKKSTNTAEELTNVTPRVLLTTAVEIWPAHRLRHPRPPPLAEEFIRMPKKTRGHKATRLAQLEAADDDVEDDVEDEDADREAHGAHAPTHEKAAKGACPVTGIWEAVWASGSILESRVESRVERDEYKNNS